MKKYAAVVFILVLAVILPGCTPAATSTPSLPSVIALGDTLQSDKPRETSPLITVSDAQALVDGNSAFAFALYQQIKGQEGNLFCSPFSISQALAMTYAGARGETERAMAEALHFTLPQARLHLAFNSLDLELATRGQGAQGTGGEGFKLHVVNAIWGQKDYPFLIDFLDTLAVNYGAGLRIVDFMKESEPSQIAINNWVADQTEQKVQDLIPPGKIDYLTRLVLTNAIYFNASWEHPFPRGATRYGQQFHLLDGGTAQVTMMRQGPPIAGKSPWAEFPYYESANYKAVELPYDGEELSMLIVLPAEGQFAAIEGQLSAEFINDIAGQMEMHEVHLSMPVFSFESSLDLKESLTAMGMGVAFTSSADFSGIDGTGGLFIQNVLHKALVSVNEAGTEAAAGSAVGLCASIYSYEFVANRPFIFLIRDIKTGSIIFLGRVLNPAE